MCCTLAELVRFSTAKIILVSVLKSILMNRSHFSRHPEDVQMLTVTLFTERGRCLQNEDVVYRKRTLFTERERCLQKENAVYRKRTLFTERGRCLQNEDVVG